jgi:uridine kinase
LKRHRLLEHIAKTILELQTPFVTRVAIDGVDGAGKTTFANDLAVILQLSGRPIIRASVDGFHNPRAVRYRLGKTSPEGFFLDFYNYPLLKKVLLEPLSPNSSGGYQIAAFDHRLDTEVYPSKKQAIKGSILIFDGIFLHRPELCNYWDYSMFLEVDFTTSYARMAKRDGSSPDPLDLKNHRYFQGQQLYLSTCQPIVKSSLVIDYNDLENPIILKW